MRSFGKQVLNIFYKAAYCYRCEDFFRYLSAIRNQKFEAFRKLTNEIPVNAWARCFSPVRRYGFMTSNFCESLNNKLLWARMLPVCSLLECVRTTIEKLFAVRRASAEGSNHPLTQWTQLWLDP
ncbi:mutator-like transposase [Striga asiatica]|uniref:Mutator-like transposase n=1 Tax=Striga asiatica TaxID=4170 RepID=A0A5A7RLK4_STRAF|nr:mutator-like transposase [Striga asiatica]